MESVRRRFQTRSMPRSSSPSCGSAPKWCADWKGQPPLDGLGNERLVEDHLDRVDGLADDRVVGLDLSRVMLREAERRLADRIASVTTRLRDVTVKPWPTRIRKVACCGTAYDMSGLTRSPSSIRNLVWQARHCAGSWGLLWVGFRWGSGS
jgi:hypothetical protein